LLLIIEVNQLDKGEKMKRKYVAIALSFLLIFLMSCNLINTLKGNGGSDSDDQTGSIFNSNPNSESDSNPASSSNSSSSKINIKKFDGEIKIDDQWYQVLDDGTIYYALLVENTSQKLTVTKFVQGATITDGSGSTVPVTNLVSTDASQEIEMTIFPQSRQLVCMNYAVEKGANVSNISFSIGKEITAVDLGYTQNPIEAESGQFSEESKYVNSNVLGTFKGSVSNLNSTDIVYPVFTAAAFDHDGKLTGCGIDYSYTFIPAKQTLPVEVPLFGSQKPTSVQLYPAYGYAGEDVQKYKKAEPIQLSEVTFIQDGDTVTPFFTLTNTADGMIVDVLMNVIIYGADDELLLNDSWRRDGIPAGMSLGPAQGNDWNIPVDKTVSKVVIQVHTMDVRNEQKEITAESITLGPGYTTTDSEGEMLVTKAKNTTDKDMYAGIGAVCTDSNGKTIGASSGMVVIPANAETEVKIVNAYSHTQGKYLCDDTTTINFNIWKIYEN
jgi:hypothetical protein